jgi:hypothetical protein
LILTINIFILQIKQQQCSEQEATTVPKLLVSQQLMKVVSMEVKQTIASTSLALLSVGIKKNEPQDHEKYFYYLLLLSISIYLTNVIESAPLFSAVLASITSQQNFLRLITIKTTSAIFLFNTHLLSVSHITVLQRPESTYKKRPCKTVHNL